MRYLVVLLLGLFTCYSAVAQNQAKGDRSGKDEKT